jgi:methoxymalonate biosynthesis protein
MAPRRGNAVSESLVKCVVWDIDKTLLHGVYLESPDHPPAADPAMVKLMAELDSRGILHAIASKNPPQAAAHAAAATGQQFAAIECGWGRKADALAAIAGRLGIGTGALAFVDDDPYERAEVSATLPEVLVLSPGEMTGAVDWPQLRPAVVTSEARRRGELYAARQRRQQAADAFGGSGEEFLRSVGTRVTVAPATAADAPRLHELSLRTHQFNSLPRVVSQAEFESLAGSAGSEVLTVRLSDAFGDDGIVGGCVTSQRDGQAVIGLLMMSCRAMGRGVIGALLAWLARETHQRGASALEIACVLTEWNVPLRLALASAGFRAVPGSTAEPGIPVTFRRDLAGALPDVPSWLHAPAEVAGELRGLLAAVTGRPELAAIGTGTPLFGPPVALDSLAGTLLLREIQRRYRVDVAAEDLNLDSLATLGTLAAFVSEHAR